MTRRTEQTEHARRVALVTGAGSGIGRATAKRLARAGWRVVIAARNAENLATTAEQSGCPDRVVVHPVDLTDPAAADALAAQIERACGGLDALINVAGYAALAPIERTSDELWDTTLAINLTAVMRLTRACWGLLERRGGGVIVNVSSMASIDPFPGFAAYAAAKAAVNMWTLVTAREGEAIGVRAVAVAPGAVETPMLRGLFDTDAISPTATMAPDQIAQVIQACVTGERSFEPGEVIQITPDA